MNEKLQGLKVASSFSQQKNELILGFVDYETEREFFIRADLNPGFTCLSFPESFSRARKNSADLFQELIGKKVEQVHLFQNERCFSLTIERYELLFKMFGNRSNVVLFENGVPVELFRNSLKSDKELVFTNMHRTLEQDLDAYVKQEGNVKKVYPTLGPLIVRKLEQLDYKKQELEEQWDLVQKLIRKLKDIYLVRFEDELRLSLVEIGQTEQRFEDPLHALNEFYFKKIRDTALDRELTPMLQKVRQEIRKTGNYILKSEKKLAELTEGTSYKEMADILMANMHQIEAGEKKVTLNNFYTGKDIDIKLNPRLSVQKNAENYYRKSKNQKKESDQLRENLESRKIALNQLEEHLKFLESDPDLKELRSFTKDSGFSTKIKEEVNLPYMVRKIDTFEVFIGKNAKANDELTMKVANRGDIWLHARDVAGSHVVIRQKAGTNIPSSVIEKAASLAAYYSKRKNDTLSPVIYVDRKFVRKFKGAKPGQVKVDHEKVILVKPSRD